MQDVAQTQTCLITRRQYDELLDAHTEWMASSKWTDIGRKWLLGGVRLTLQPEQVNEFLEKCCSCGFNPGLVRT